MREPIENSKVTLLVVLPVWIKAPYLSRIFHQPNSSPFVICDRAFWGTWLVDGIRSVAPGTWDIMLKSQPAEVIPYYGQMVDWKRFISWPRYIEIVEIKNMPRTQDEIERRVARLESMVATLRKLVDGEEAYFDVETPAGEQFGDG